SSSSLSETATGQNTERMTFFTSHDGTTIAFHDEGEGDPVLLLHGFLNTSKNWEKAALRTQLLDQGYRVIRPDLRGCGDSDHPHDAVKYANDAETKDILALMDYLQIENYCALGYSRGSIILANLLTQDARITRAVIGGMGLDFTDPEWPRRKAFAQAFADPPVLTEMTRGANEYAHSINADFRSLFLQQSYQPSPSPEQLRRVEIPILVVSGSEDSDNGDPGKLERLFPKGKLSIVPGDHNNTYKSEVFAAAVMAFLKQG
ncbi:MAG: alpha/beta hydrolase, partial [Bacteroidota bacterium]